MSGTPTVDVASTELGPVSSTLASELRDEARKHGILVWLDKEKAYTQFVDKLATGAGDFPFPVLAYRNSFLDLMRALDGQEDGVAMQPLVLHMPGFNEEEIAQTPAYELYRAGRRYRIKLPTLITKAAGGKVAPNEIEAALQLPTLAEADAWLSGLLQGGQASPENTLAVLSPNQLFDDLVINGPVTTQLKDPSMFQTALDYIERTLGLDEHWRSMGGGNASGHPRDDLQQQMLSWVLCVEFVHDLRREPKDELLKPLKNLPQANVDAARALASHVRHRHAHLYMRGADEFEGRLERETKEATADDLGRIDTFRFEDKTVFAAALGALTEEDWSAAARYAEARTEEGSFWVAQDPRLRAGWAIVRLAAELGLAATEHEHLLRDARNLPHAIELYSGGGFKVDSAQRRLEQAWHQLPLVQLRDLPALRLCVNGVRSVYRRWADEQAVLFNRLCKKHGFLPESSFQQRNIFDEIVRPLTVGGETVAYFMVDGLRFEMAKELEAHLAKESGSRLRLNARYAELPTLTEVGMNVLAPVAREGRLQIDISDRRIRGFRAGEARVSSPKSRQKAIHERVHGETCPLLSLEEVLDRDAKALRKTLSRARLVIVHAEGIDKAGEKGVGLSHFADELQRLRTAWFRLRDVGVQRFVLAADHGFLLQDDTTLDPVRHGRNIDAKRRHVIEDVAADHEGEVRVSSTELRYDCDEVQFMFPESTMPFDIGDRAKLFLHGGNSLQERVIPVLTAEYRHAKGSAAIKYIVKARAETGDMGLHQISGVVRPEFQEGLGFGAEREIELRLRVVDDPSVSVELVDAPGARIEAGAVVATVDSEFRLLFGLRGPHPLRAKVELGPAAGGEDVIPYEVAGRFAVEVVRAPHEAEPGGKVSADFGWLEDLPEGGIRKVFEYIQKFGAINEADATRMLGGPRQFRRFSREFEQHAQLAPFALRIDAASGTKRYVREGGHDA